MTAQPKRAKMTKSYVEKIACGPKDQFHWDGSPIFMYNSEGRFVVCYDRIFNRDEKHCYGRGTTTGKEA